MDDWISVEDTVPEESYNFGGTGFSEDVLVMDKFGDVEVSRFVYPWRNMHLYGFANHQKEKDVVYWKYVGALPEGVE